MYLPLEGKLRQHNIMTSTVTIFQKDEDRDSVISSQVMEEIDSLFGSCESVEFVSMLVVGLGIHREKGWI